MSKWFLLTSIAMTLGGCCGFGSGCGVTPSARLLAWDGLYPEYSNPISKRSPGITSRTHAAAIETTSKIASDKEAELAALPKNSPEWWSIHEAIDAQADARLAKNLIICRGCFPSSADERTGSIK
jgi:hypothetical protein